jgi:membrane-bound ClpP family serine protease
MIMDVKRSGGFEKRTVEVDGKEYTWFQKKARTKLVLKSWVKTALTYIACAVVSVLLVAAGFWFWLTRPVSECEQHFGYNASACHNGEWERMINK